MTRGYWVRRMDARRPRPPSSIPDVSQPHRPPARSPETSERRTRRAWWIFAGSFFVLGLIAVLRLVVEPSPTDALVVALVVIVGFAADPPSPGGHRARDRPARGGRIVRPHPVEPVALGLARRDPRCHRRRAGRRDRRRPHRRRASAPGRPRPGGDARQRPAGRPRLDHAPADRRPRGRRSTPSGDAAQRAPVAIPLAIQAPPSRRRGRVPRPVRRPRRAHRRRIAAGRLGRWRSARRRARPRAARTPADRRPDRRSRARGSTA